MQVESSEDSGLRDRLRTMPWERGSDTQPLEGYSGLPSTC